MWRRGSSWGGLIPVTLSNPTFRDSWLQLTLPVAQRQGQVFSSSRCRTIVAMCTLTRQPAGDDHGKKSKAAIESKAAPTKGPGRPNILVVSSGIGAPAFRILVVTPTA